jgi:hypothetical protein
MERTICIYGQDQYGIRETIHILKCPNQKKMVFAVKKCFVQHSYGISMLLAGINNFITHEHWI